jgi:hypothetical protein
MHLPRLRMRLRSVMFVTVLIALALSVGRAVHRRQSLLALAANYDAAAFDDRCAARRAALQCGLYETTPRTELELRLIEEEMHSLPSHWCVVFRTSLQELDSETQETRLIRARVLRRVSDRHTENARRSTEKRQQCLDAALFPWESFPASRPLPTLEEHRRRCEFYANLACTLDQAKDPDEASPQSKNRGSEPVPTSRD